MKTKSIKTPANWKSLSPHPLAQLIEFGTGISVDAMAAHIKTHGYNEDEAIVLFEDFILDGRHRHAACKIAGVIPPFREFVGKNAGAYVSNKLFRQYPTIAERAKLAAAHANLPTGSAKEPNASNEAPSMTQAEAAKTFGVSRSSIQRAKAARTPRKPRPKKSGQILFDWKEYFRDFGKLSRHIDRLGELTKSSHSTAAEELRRLLGMFLLKFRQYGEFQLKEKAPDFRFGG